MAKDRNVPLGIGLLGGNAKVYNTIAEMQKDSKLKTGKVVEVLGYYQAGDGAGHKRVIADSDDGSGVQLGNGLWANIIHNGEVNVSWFGAKGDGVTDDTQAIQKAIYNSKSCLMDLGKIYIVTDTIRVGYGYKSLKSVTSGGMGLPEIKYNGAENRKKAVIILGNNNIGEFKKEATNITLENIKINANNLCGIGLYGTYVKNESVVRQISIYNTLEYGAYFAKSWYATYENITVSDSKGNGIALGMELRFSDGTILKPIDESENIIQMNGTFISKLRAINCGKGIDTQDNKYGYGIGIGSGHCINVKNFVSEGCEIGVLIWRKFGSPFNVSNFYCEANTKELLLDLRENIYSDTCVGKITNGYIENFEYLLGTYSVYKGIILENMVIRTRANFSGTDIFDLRNSNFYFNSSNPIVSENITSENIISAKYDVDLRYTSSLNLKIPITKNVIKRLHLISDKEYDITGATYKCFDIYGNLISSYSFPNILKKGNNYINTIPDNTYKISLSNTSVNATNVDIIVTKL